MEKTSIVKGIVAPLDARNVDTDQIIPKQFLKRIERSGYGEFLFFDWRFEQDGKTLDADFEMNAERYRGASILLTRENFGCGSSREHAPWALHDYGFRAVLAPSFADIFFNNCINNAIVPVVIPETIADRLFVEVRANPGYQLQVDLPRRRIQTPAGEAIAFDLDTARAERLINGWDQIGLTLLHESDIEAYEAASGIT